MAVSGAEMLEAASFNRRAGIPSSPILFDVLREHSSENHAVLKYGSTSTLSDFVQILCRVSF